VTLLETRAEVGGRVRSRHDICTVRVIEAGAELIGANHFAWPPLDHELAGSRLSAAAMRAAETAHGRCEYLHALGETTDWWGYRIDRPTAVAPPYPSASGLFATPLHPVFATFREHPERRREQQSHRAKKRRGDDRMSHTLFGLLHRRYGEPSSVQAAIHAIREASERFHVPLPGEEREPNGRSVVVIGAGLAGLSAGSYLSAAGFEVTVLEAQGQVGGRVESQSTVFNGRVIEAGAELIGANHPLWVGMASKYQLGLSVFTPDNLFDAAWLDQPTFLRGQMLSRDEAKQLYDQMDGVFAKISADASYIANPYRPWENGNAAQWDATPVANKLKEFGVPDGGLLWDALKVHLENDQTVAVEQQSYLGLTAVVRGGQLGDDTHAYWTMSEVFRCEQGNQALARKLRDIIDATPGCAVRLNAPVTAIDIRDNDVQVSVGTNTFICDYAVLAVPQPVWNKLTISPPGIDPSWHITTGPAVKYLSPVRSRFWLAKNQAPAGVSDQLGMTWEGTDNQMVVGDQSIEMSVFAGGPWADLARNSPDRRDYFTNRLVELFPGYIEQALDPTFMDWPANPWIGCGYSCPTLGQVTKAGPRLAGMYNNRLAFAGEHTVMGMFGYMEGALESGLRASDLIKTTAGVT
jgi:monoamine oxidase